MQKIKNTKLLKEGNYGGRMVSHILCLMASFFLCETVLKQPELVKEFEPISKDIATTVFLIVCVLLFCFGIKHMAVDLSEIAIILSKSYIVREVTLIGIECKGYKEDNSFTFIFDKGMPIEIAADFKEQVLDFEIGDLCYVIKFTNNKYPAAVFNQENNMLWSCNR